MSVPFNRKSISPIHYTVFFIFFIKVMLFRYITTLPFLSQQAMPFHVTVVLGIICIFLLFLLQRCTRMNGMKTRFSLFNK